ncbi:DNA-directed RNA polymerase II subunit 4 [Bienertia sinuspersici]
MNCEADDILHGIQEQMGLQYAKVGGRYSSPKTVRQICVIANTCPENVEEAFMLNPSLKAKQNKSRDQLEDAISQLVKLKHPTESL